MLNARAFILSLFFCAVFAFDAKPQVSFYDLGEIREVRIYFEESNWDHILDSLHEYVGEDGRLMGDVSIEGKMLHHIGVRYKGYSSFNPDDVKSPFNLDLEYTLNNQNYQGYTKLKLSNVIQDPSFVREVLSYEIARKYVPASLANFANVYVNDTLMGLYTNVEAVDKNFVRSRYHSGDHSFFKGAPENLIIPDGQNANLVYYDGDTSSYKPFYKLESDNPETSWPDLVHFIDVLNNDTAEIDQVLNVDRALWMHAINYALVNLDSYIGYSQNYYLYMDDYGRFNPIVWDFNMSFGSFKETDGMTAPPGGLSILKRKMLDPVKMLTTAPQSPRPLIVNLLSDSTRRRMYLAHIRTIINENIRNGWYLTRGAEIQGLIDAAVVNDTNKFYPYAQFHLNLDTTVGSGNNVFPGIRDFMEARMAYLDSLPGFSGAPAVSQVNHDPACPVKGEMVWITAHLEGASEAFLAYRFMTDGLFEKVALQDHGLHHDSLAGDGIYGAGITVAGSAIQYYLYAQNDSAGVFSPERAEYEFYNIQPAFGPGDLVINEMMSLNSATVKDQDNEYEGWIELFNATNEDQRLGNVSLSDDPAELHKWTLPDTVLPANGYLVIWADNETDQAGLHAGFTLPADGGLLLVSDANTSIIDSVTYGLQVNGKSYGRFPNGYGPFNYMLPTFAGNNLMGTNTASQFLLYPNPANGVVYLEMQEPGPYGVVEIFDSRGILVFSSEARQDHSTDASVLALDVSCFNNGLYYVRVKSEDHTMAAKFFVVN